MTVTIAEAQDRLADLIANAAPGEVIVITRDEKPVARIVTEQIQTPQPGVPGSAKGMIAYMAERSGGSFAEMTKSDFFSGALSAAASQPMPAGAPPYFAEMLKFPYLNGLQFVIAAYRRGGWAELDRVYANPPRSTREILHPSDYFTHRFSPGPFNPAPAVEVPHLLSVEHLGEWHWRFLAGEQNAQGWTSDRVTIAQNKFCETTVLVETQWDSDAQARRFYDAYTRFLDEAGIGLLGRVDGKSVRVAYGADRPLMERFLAR